MKMEPIVSSETSAIRTQTPGNYPKRNNLHLEHGESLRTRITIYFIWNIILNLLLMLKYNANNLVSWCYVTFIFIILELRQSVNNHQWRIKQRDIFLTLYKTLGYYFSTRILLPDLKQRLNTRWSATPLSYTSLKMSYVHCHCNVWPSGNMVYGLVKLLQTIHPKKRGRLVGG